MPPSYQVWYWRYNSFSLSRDPKDQVIKVLNDFVVKSPLRYVTILPNLVAIGTNVVNI